MTDSEIIKALERCGQHRECCYCNSLEECGSKRVLTTSALDLINRLKKTNRKNERIIELADKTIETQKAEIERLQDKNYILEEQLEKAESLSDQLGNDVDIKLKYIYELKERLATAKTEAIKEFWGKLRAYMNNIIIEVSGYSKAKTFVSYGDNLIKKMTEGKDDV